MVIAYINQHRSNTLCQTFHELALETWDMLHQSFAAGMMTVGEETITDNNLFAIQSLHPDKVAIIKFSKVKESQIGADWEWWLGNLSDGWIKMRIQAKKIIPKQLAYKGVDHPSGTKQQITNLISKAGSDGFIPAYCLYNTNLAPRTPMWGCTLASAESMLAALKASGKSGVVDFAKIQSSAFPWEKLVCEKEVKDSFPRRIQRQFTEIVPKSRKSAFEEAYSRDLPQHLNVMLKPFFAGRSEFIETIGDSVDEPVTKYIVVTSDQPIFPPRQTILIDKEK
jgi:hypothetical protein